MTTMRHSVEPRSWFSLLWFSSCNGIVCLGHNMDLILVLWNPSLRKLLRLDIPHIVGPTERSIQGVGSDPSRVYRLVSVTYSLIHGIGFDYSSNDYKAVSVARSRDPWELGIVSVCVYSINEGAWRQVSSDFVPSGDCIHFRGVDLNGVIHWLVEDGSSGPGVPVSILTFNLADETFGEIPLPRGLYYNHTHYEHTMLMVVPGSGTEEKIACLHKSRSRRTINLWVMDVYGVKESWRLAVSLNGQQNGYTSIVNVRKNGEIVVELEGGRLASLNLSDMSLKVVSDVHRSIMYIGPYIESLVFLRSNPRLAPSNAL